MSSIPFFSTVYPTRFLGNNRDNDAREGAMPSNTLAAFAAGLFVATLVLTHDASAGDELLVARGLLLPSPLPDVEIHASWNASAPDPNVVEGRASDAVNPSAPSCNNCWKQLLVREKRTPMERCQGNLDRRGRWSFIAIIAIVVGPV